MLRRMLMAVALVASLSVVMIGAQSAILVLNNGERVGGDLTYKGGGEVTLNVNGQPRDYSWDDIAIVAFIPGDPSVNELQQLPQGNNPPELDRHMIVTRDGRVFHGKVYKFSPGGETLTYDPRDGGMSARRDIPTNDIARLYISAPGARNVYAGLLSSPANAVATSGTAPGGITVTVNGNQQWVDTNIDVRRGDRVTFFGRGDINVMPPTASAGVGGTTVIRGNYPVANGPAGALIGRVGASSIRSGSSAPFLIGSNNSPFSMPATGRLYVGINDDNVADNTGAFEVTIVR